MRVEMELRTWPAFLFFFFLPFLSSAEEKSSQPYLDHLKQFMEPQSSSEAYTEKIMRKLEQEGPKPSAEGYTERLRNSDPLRGQNPSESYTEKLKEKIAPKEEGGAIQAVAEGRSELEAKKLGSIHHAMGLRYGLSITRGISGVAGTQLREFNSIYGANYSADISFFYEYQPFHSEWFGNIGIVGLGGIGYFSGKGKYATTLVKPGGGGNFAEESPIQFQFFAVPVTIGVDYRFNLLRILRPYVLVGPTLIGYLESRNDSVAGHRGYSTALLISGGVSISLDWLSSKADWDLYSNYGIHHLYLTVDYSHLASLSGDVSFNISGFLAGLAFEF